MHENGGVTDSLPPHPFLALSVGNSNLHFALVHGADLRCFASRALDPWPLTLDDLLGGLGSDSSRVSIDTAAVASVRPDLVDGLLESLKRSGVSAKQAGIDFPVPLENRYASPDEVGIDRLLGVLAASRLFPGEGVVVVDFGTALTFNVGSPDGAFLGGLIGIGASSAASALPGRTPMLPRVELSSPEGFVARDTHGAIRGGIFWEVAGGVERVLEGLRNELAFKFHVVATGGDASALVPHVRGIDRVEPRLVLQGLSTAFHEAVE